MEKLSRFMLISFIAICMVAFYFFVPAILFAYMGNWKYADVIHLPAYIYIDLIIGIIVTGHILSNCFDKEFYQK